MVMKENVDKDELFELKDRLEAACVELFQFIDTVKKGDVSMLASVDRGRLNTLASRVSEEAKRIANIKKRP